MGSRSRVISHKKVRKTEKILLCLLCLFVANSSAQTPSSYVLRPARVFDGESAQLHDGWVVVVRGEKIDAAGPATSVRIPAGAESEEHTSELQSRENLVCRLLPEKKK